MLIAETTCEKSFFLQVFQQFLFSSLAIVKNKPFSHSPMNLPLLKQRASHPRELVFVHAGDFHGDLEPHPNTRADANGLLEGGFARVTTVVKEIKTNNPGAIHVHAGDTIAGRAVVSFTRGDALVRIVDQLGVDVFVPGGWIFNYSALINLFKKVRVFAITFGSKFFLWNKT